MHFQAAISTPLPGDDNLICVSEDSTEESDVEEEHTPASSEDAGHLKKRGPQMEPDRPSIMAPDFSKMTDEERHQDHQERLRRLDEMNDRIALRMARSRIEDALPTKQATRGATPTLSQEQPKTTDRRNPTQVLTTPKEWTLPDQPTTEEQLATKETEVQEHQRTPSSSPSYNHLRCEYCMSEDLPAQMLICDGCNKGFHLGCLIPPLSDVPTDSWHCKSCRRTTRLDATEDLDLLYFLRTGNYQPDLDPNGKKRVQSRAKRYTDNTEHDNHIIFRGNARFGPRPLI